MEVDVAVDVENTLGECPLWSVDRNLLYWTDIDEHKLFTWSSSTDELVTIDTPGRVGSFAFCDSDGLLLACENRILRATSDGVIDSEVAAVPSTRNTLRLNDGRCDRDGHFIVGEYAYESPGSGRLFVLGSPIKVP